MTTKEFSAEFDILYNNIMSNAAPGLDDYEKSVFLTQAQEQLLKGYFLPQTNMQQLGIDDSSERQLDFSALITVKTIQENSTIIPQIDKRSKMYVFPEDVLLVLNESVLTSNGDMQVIPLNYTQYTQAMLRPYKEPQRYQVWRLIGNSNQSEHIIELIGHTKETFKEYTIRYVRKPVPIIITDLEKEYDGLVSINGIMKETQCELNSIIHQDILQRAVQIAKISYIGQGESNNTNKKDES